MHFPALGAGHISLRGWRFCLRGVKKLGGGAGTRPIPLAASPPRVLTPREQNRQLRRLRLHVFALNSDWFIALAGFALIGQSNYFGFDFTAIN